VFDAVACSVGVARAGQIDDESHERGVVSREVGTDTVAQRIDEAIATRFDRHGCGAELSAQLGGVAAAELMFAQRADQGYEQLWDEAMRGFPGMGWRVLSRPTGISMLGSCRVSGSVAVSGGGARGVGGAVRVASISVRGGRVAMVALIAGQQPGQQQNAAQMQARATAH
jgi:hypothetical protein